MKSLNELTVVQALTGLKNGEFTSLDLTNACLTQIEKFDSKLGTFITLNKENALIQAELADAEITSHGEDVFKQKPLLGIPYAVKDNFSTKGIQTTAASNILKGYIPPYESTVTQKLKDAGAILLGKTNMDAFAHGSSNETSDFFPAKNPWDISRVPGGSSGGSAVTTAAHMSIFSIGSETAGSVRGPAAWSGVTGLKPTYGRVSRYGVIAMASSTDSPGPLTKTAEDAALILEIIAGVDSCDATSSPEPVGSYFNNLTKADLKTLKIGRAKQYFVPQIELGVREQVENAIEKFRELGATVIDIDLMDPKYSIAVYTILQRSEVASNLARFDGIRFGHTRNNFGHEAKKRMMLGAYTLSSGYYDAYYAKAQKVRTLIVEDFKKAFEKVDLIVGPTMPNIALHFGESDKVPIFGELADMLAEPSSIAGLSGISIPCGFSQGMPVGIQLIGDQLKEQQVLDAAYVYQQHTTYHTKFPNLEETTK